MTPRGGASRTVSEQSFAMVLALHITPSDGTNPCKLSLERVSLDPPEGGK
jgi:hypothetical protein